MTYPPRPESQIMISYEDAKVAGSPRGCTPVQTSNATSTRMPCDWLSCVHCHTVGADFTFWSCTPGTRASSQNQDGQRGGEAGEGTDLDALGRVVEDVGVALHVVRVVLPRPLRAPRHAVPARADQRRVLLPDARGCICQGWRMRMRVSMESHGSRIATTYICPRGSGRGCTPPQPYNRSLATFVRARHGPGEARAQEKPE